MSRLVHIPLLGLCVVLVGCVPPNYRSGGYATSGSSGPVASPAAPTTVAATANAGNPAAAPSAAPAARLDPPQLPAPQTALALPPLNLPRQEEWSSAQCPSRAVTFSGPSQPLQTGASEAASFQEARQYSEGDYYEVAECFCVKSGDLSNTTKADADAVMAQTARQFEQSSHLRLTRLAFVEDSPMGKYSEFRAQGVPPSQTVLVQRIYWKGQCSMRVATQSSPDTAARAAQFLASLQEVTPPPATAEAGPTAAPEPMAAAGPLDDFGSRVRERSLELQTAGAAPPAADSVAPTETTATPNMDVAARLQQLELLRKQGLIGKDEYQNRRRAILDGI